MNILFKNIEIHNFLSLGDVSLDLNECGFVLVKGHNEEGSVIQSNGSGKSALFDAIFWTITGETLRGSDSVINEKSNDVTEDVENVSNVSNTKYSADELIGKKVVELKTIATELGISLPNNVNKATIIDLIVKN